MAFTCAIFWPKMSKSDLNYSSPQLLNMWRPVSIVHVLPKISGNLSDSIAFPCLFKLKTVNKYLIFFFNLKKEIAYSFDVNFANLIWIIKVSRLKNCSVRIYLLYHDSNRKMIVFQRRHFKKNFMRVNKALYTIHNIRKIPKKYLLNWAKLSCIFDNSRKCLCIHI